MLRIKKFLSGGKNDFVRKELELLYKLGYFGNIPYNKAVDGYYGEMTKAAEEAAIRDGKITREQLNAFKKYSSIVFPTSLLSSSLSSSYKGYTIRGNPSVFKLLVDLMEKGLLKESDLDGMMGPKTRNAISRDKGFFQRVALNVDKSTAKINKGSIKVKSKSKSETEPIVNVGEDILNTFLPSTVRIYAKDIAFKRDDDIRAGKAHGGDGNGSVYFTPHFPEQKRKTYDETDMSTALLAALDHLVRFRAEQLGINEDSFANNKEIVVSFDAEKNYPLVRGDNLPYTSPELSMSYRLYNPLGQIEHTLGDFTIKFTKDGYLILDTYDFNDDLGNFNGTSKGKSLYVDERRRAKERAHKKSDPDKQKMHFSINRKVNHW